MPPDCPECDATALPIVHGMPTLEMKEAAERGDIVLGGCVRLPGEKSPKWACPECEHRWPVPEALR